MNETITFSSEQAIKGIVFHLYDCNYATEIVIPSNLIDDLNSHGYIDGNKTLVFFKKYWDSLDNQHKLNALLLSCKIYVNFENIDSNGNKIDRLVGNVLSLIYENNLPINKIKSKRNKK